MDRLCVGAIALCGALVVLFAEIPTVRGEELTLSAAISMKEAVEQVGRRFTDQHPGVTLRLNFGSSGELEKQIEGGAPVDVFISAGEREMDVLERRGLIRPETRRAIARNVLTVIKPSDSRLDLSSPATLTDARVRRIVIGDPRTVPAGQYAEQSLRSLGLWPSVQPKLVFAGNVRQALEYVARGEVEAGFVYATDVARRASGVMEAFRPPEDTYRPIVYPAAVVKQSAHPQLGAAFMAILASAEGQDALARLGFQRGVAGSAR
jgi:molybdate transport system substrate-binding protein